jgi:phospho-N-acetylmuramoyl-pentapeptide-transferase
LVALTIAVSVTILSGPWVIRALSSGFRERIASDSERLNQLHAGKQHTPTMGGLLIMLAFLTGAVLSIQSGSVFVWLVIISTLAFSAIGACDDWIKLRTSKKGLSVRQKFAAQLAVSFVTSLGLFFACTDVVAGSWSLQGWLPSSLNWLFIPWATFVIVACSNSVNLTDGLDGLAAGCTTITASSLTLITIHALSKSSAAAPTLLETAVFSSALAGAALGFLWFNRHPARVFMGDTGSLPMGSLLAVLALACRLEFTLLLIGAVFVVETLSVILQVTWYRRTGKRILLCSPLHNHFVFRKVAEPRIVKSFWAAAIIASAAAILLF